MLWVSISQLPPADLLLVLFEASYAAVLLMLSIVLMPHEMLRIPFLDSPWIKDRIAHCCHVLASYYYWNAQLIINMAFIKTWEKLNDIQRFLLCPFQSWQWKSRPNLIFHTLLILDAFSIAIHKYLYIKFTRVAFIHIPKMYDTETPSAPLLVWVVLVVPSEGVPSNTLAHYNKHINITTKLAIWEY